MCFSWLFGNRTRTPSVPSILPAIAVNEIMAGRLPQINVNTLFLKRGETCHYADNALWIKETKKRKTTRSGGGSSYPGIFIRGSRWYHGGSTSISEDITESQEIKGVLYITNQRIVFTSQRGGFDKNFRDLSAVQPYANCIELQYGNDLYKVFIPDGNIANTLIHLLQ